MPEAVPDCSLLTESREATCMLVKPIPVEKPPIIKATIRKRIDPTFSKDRKRIVETMIIAKENPITF